MRTGKYLIFLITVVSGLACVKVKEEWVARYDGPGNGWDLVTALTLDAQGNVYVTGMSVNPEANFDFATIKYNTQGEEQWVALYNGSGNGGDGARAIAVDPSGNVYVTGMSTSQNDNHDYVTIKYNSQGKEEWVALYNGPSNGWDDAKALALDHEGNVYVTGTSWDSISHEDYLTIKYSPQGEEKWVARCNGPENGSDIVSSLVVDVSGNIYITGWVRSEKFNHDYATVKYNSQGEEQWIVLHGGIGKYMDIPTGLTVDDESNVYVTGRCVNDNSDYCTVKYSPQGLRLWFACYNGPGDGTDEANALAVDEKGNVYVTGRSQNENDNYDYATIKYNMQGEEQWIARYSGPGNRWNAATALVVDTSGNVYVTGSIEKRRSDEDYCTIKYNPQGQKQWTVYYNGIGNNPDGAEAVAVDDSGNIYVTGISENRNDNKDIVTIKYSQRRR